MRRPFRIVDVVPDVGAHHGSRPFGQLDRVGQRHQGRAENLGGGVGFGSAAGAARGYLGGWAGRCRSRFGAGYRSARDNAGARVGGYGKARAEQNKPARAVLTSKMQGDLRARCRSLERDNSLARAISRRLCDNIIADGYVVEVNSGDPAYDRLADELLTRWIEEVELARISQGVVRAGLTDGDRLLVKVRKGPR